MQNIFKSQNWTNLRFKVHQYLHYYQDAIKHTANFPQYSNQNQIFRLFGTLSYNTLHQIRREYKAIYSLLIRSSYIIQRFDISKNDYYRFFSNSDIKKNRNEPNESKKTGSLSGEGNESNKNRNQNQNLRKLALLLTMLTIYISSVLYFMSSSNDMSNNELSRSVSWNEFIHQMLAKGEVKRLIVRPEHDSVTIILHDGAVVKGKRSLYSAYHMSMPNISMLEEKVRLEEEKLGIRNEMGVQIVYDRSTWNVSSLFMILIVLIIIYAIAQSVIKNFNFPGNMFSQMTRAKFTLIDPLTGGGKGVRFSDVAGLQEAKTEIMEFVDYLKSPDRYKTLGAKVPKGALLLGPPGCGKTLLAKAIATESNVPFLSMNGSEFIEMIGGLGAARVRNLFKEGKRRAPSIIYIDEIDAIGKKRSNSNFDRSNSESEQTLNQLLTEMDGMVSNQEVIVLASTNRAEVLDKALLRPGRFDRHILIDLPTLTERKQIFEQHLKGISLDKSPSVFSKRLAFLTPGFSGADIANICNEAALHAARMNKKHVTGNDLLYAVDRIIAGTEKRENAITPSEKQAIAYHEAGHALVGWLLEHTDALLKVTIVPRTNRALGFTQFSTSDKKLYTSEQLFERMCMMLGGRVAESLTFNKITTGAVNDLEKVTKIAYAEVQQYGMDTIVGPLSFNPEQLDTKTRKPYSKMLGNTMDQEARMIIVKVYKRTEKLLIENKDKLKALAEALLEKETLTYEEIEKLIGPPPFGEKKLIESTEFESSIPLPEAPLESK